MYDDLNLQRMYVQFWVFLLLNDKVKDTNKK